MMIYWTVWQLIRFIIKSGYKYIPGSKSFDREVMDDLLTMNFMQAKYENLSKEKLLTEKDIAVGRDVKLNLKLRLIAKRNEKFIEIIAIKS